MSVCFSEKYVSVKPLSNATSVTATKRRLSYKNTVHSCRLLAILYNTVFSPMHILFARTTITPISHD